MGNRYLIVSDLHLADVEDHSDGWKAYKSSRFLFDQELEELVHRFMADGEGGDQLTLILNGDTFDFDLVTAVPDDPPWPVTRFERKRGLNATAEKSAWKLELILSHHPHLLCTLANFIASGHKLVFVMGNHDRELHFPEVQRAFIDSLERCAQQAGASLAPGSIQFEPWFYYVRDEVFVEHGQQYDYYTSFKYVLWPVVGNEQQLALPMGNLSNRYLMTRMGYFNPHASDYILNMFAYAAHWLRYYAFSRRSLALNWAWGSLLVIAKLLRLKKKLHSAPPEQEQLLTRVARKFNLSTIDIRTLAQLQRRPITSRMYRLMRELWIDRLAIALLMTGGTVTLALVPIPLWIKLMVPLTAFPTLYFIYEWAAQGETIFTIETAIPERAREISSILPARVIAFGHTHKPRQLPLARDTFFVDTGTWAPVADPKDKSRLCPGLQNYLMVTFHRGKVTEIKLDSWMQRSLS